MTTRMLLAGATLLVLTGTACSGPRGGSGLGSVTSDTSSCAAVLPVARRAIGNHGTLVALHPVRPKADEVLRGLGTPPPLPRPEKSPHGEQRLPKSCIVAYRGSWARGELPLAPQQSGHYAVVLVTVRHPAVRLLVLTDQLPPGL